MSKVEVDQVTQQSGTTLTVGGGACKTAVVDATTVTLGRCGGTVSLASGATQTGFGRTGTVDWQTTPKTTTFTPTNGEGYFINSGSSITANLPAGSAGAIVAFSDYARNFATYNFTISPNGSEKIGGVADDLLLSVDGQATTLVYVDSTKGWVNIQNAEDTQTGIIPTFIAASVSGACNAITTCGDYKIAKFINPGTFTVTCAGNSAGANTIEYLVAAGGGSGGRDQGGGGAGGGLRTNFPSPTTAGLSVTATGYPVSVGAGAARPGSSGTPGLRGTSSVFTGSATITSAGGGAGSGNGDPGGSEVPGGAGGGGDSNTSGGTGNTPPVTPSQGKDGGTSSGPNGAGGGGGGGACGVAGGNSPGGPTAGNGGNGGGFPTAFVGPAGQPSGGSQYFSGGGGGSAHSGGVHGTGGLGGGGQGGGTTPPGVQPATGGAANQGGGGGGCGNNAYTSQTGGSGIVIIRYKFQ